MEFPDDIVGLAKRLSESSITISKENNEEMARMLTREGLVKTADHFLRSPPHKDVRGNGCSVIKRLVDVTSNANAVDDDVWLPELKEYMARPAPVGKEQPKTSVEIFPPGLVDRAKRSLATTSRVDAQRIGHEIGRQLAALGLSGLAKHFFVSANGWRDHSHGPCDYCEAIVRQGAGDSVGISTSSEYELKAYIAQRSAPKEPVHVPIRKRFPEDVVELAQKILDGAVKPQERESISKPLCEALAELGLHYTATHFTAASCSWDGKCGPSGAIVYEDPMMSSDPGRQKEIREFLSGQLKPNFKTPHDLDPSIPSDPRLGHLGCKSLEIGAFPPACAGVVLSKPVEKKEPAISNPFPPHVIELVNRANESNAGWETASKELASQLRKLGLKVFAEHFEATGSRHTPGVGCCHHSRLILEGRSPNAYNLPSHDRADFEKWLEQQAEPASPAIETVKPQDPPVLADTFDPSQPTKYPNSLFPSNIVALAEDACNRNCSWGEAALALAHELEQLGLYNLGKHFRDGGGHHAYGIGTCCQASVILGLSGQTALTVAERHEFETWLNNRSHLIQPAPEPEELAAVTHNPSWADPYEIEPDFVNFCAWEPSPEQKRRMFMRQTFLIVATSLISMATTYLGLPMVEKLLTATPAKTTLATAEADNEKTELLQFKLQSIQQNGNLPETLPVKPKRTLFFQGHERTVVNVRRPITAAEWRDVRCAVKHDEGTEKYKVVTLAPLPYEREHTELVCLWDE